MLRGGAKDRTSVYAREKTIARLGASQDGFNRASEAFVMGRVSRADVSKKALSEAFSRMHGQGFPSDDRLGRLVRDASSHTGPWPSVSVWHGTADATVDPLNADRIVRQWRAVHGESTLSAPTHEVIDGCHRYVWHDKSGRGLIEFFEIPGLGHGTPINSLGSSPCGAPGPYMLEAGISSTRHIARSWGLSGDADRTLLPVRRSMPVATDAPKMLSDAAASTAPPAAAPGRTTEVGAIIENALRAAGLMR